MPIPTIFSNQGGTALANYNYVDIANGTGIVVFYGGHAYDGTTSLGVLDENTFYSDLIYQEWTSSSTFELNTSVFNLPRIAKGIAKVSMTMFNNNATNTGDTFLTIQKVSGTVVSNISSQTKVNRPLGINSYNSTLTYLNLTQTIFKRGDILRLKIEIGVNVGYIDIYHDPANRKTSSFIDPPCSTQLKLYMPFKIDL